MPRHPILQNPSAEREQEFIDAVKRSRKLHGNWVSAPGAPVAFRTYLARFSRETHISYWVVTEKNELAGVINISEIVRGGFHSAYLGYYAFAPHHGRGYMTRGLAAVLREAFAVHRLHRLEANIQPENTASKALARRLGFRLEGYSPRYLKIAGRWRDHERWAITVEDWKKRSRKARLR